MHFCYNSDIALSYYSPLNSTNMKFVKFSPSVLAPDAMTLQSSTTESAITTNAGIFPSLPFTAAQLGTQRGKVTTAQTAQKTAALAFAEASKTLASENTKLGAMLLQEAGGIDLVAQATPATGKDIANKG